MSTNLMSLMSRMCAVLVLVSCRSSGSGSGSGSGSASVQSEQANTFRTGWASQPATPGPVFEGMVPGGPNQVKALYDKLHATLSTEYVWEPSGGKPELLAMFRDSRVVIHIEAKGERITELGLWTNDERDVGCPADLATSIREAWKSAPHATSGSLEIWLDPVHQVRALLSVGDQCRLEFEQYEPEDSWLENVGHISMVGQPVAALEAKVIARGRGKVDRGSWDDLGCGLGGGIALGEAHVEQDRVVSIRVGTFVTDIAFDGVLESVVAKRGPPTEVTGFTFRRLEWLSGTPLRIDYEAGHLDVTSGTFGSPESPK